MSLHYACATDSQNKHIYGRDNWKSNGKGSKIAQMKLLFRPIRVDSVRVLKALPGMKGTLHAPMICQVPAEPWEMTVGSKLQLPCPLSQPQIVEVLAQN